MLNLNAWLIFELCDGCTADQLMQRYIAHVASPASEADLRTDLETGVRSLQQQGLIDVRI
ncbi:MAG: PqqD family peptide modification chaperone [Tardiphaga sp.]